MMMHGGRGHSLLALYSTPSAYDWWLWILILLPNAVSIGVGIYLGYFLELWVVMAICFASTGFALALLLVVSPIRLDIFPDRLDIVLCLGLFAKSVPLRSIYRITDMSEDPCAAAGACALKFASSITRRVYIQRHAGYMDIIVSPRCPPEFIRSLHQALSVTYV